MFACGFLKSTHWLLALAIFAGGLSGTGMASAQARPAAHIEQELPRARLAGQGEFSWFGLSIYQAQLWVGEQGYQAGAPTAAPFVLDLRYARALEGAKIAGASADEMKKLNLGSEAQRLAWLLKMKAIFPDVKQGTHISGVFLPGVGARFYLDGKMLAEVQDPQFAAAFFAIWLNPDSTAKKLRQALLADAGPR